MVNRARTYIEVEKLSVPAAATRVGVSGRTLNRYLAEPILNSVVIP